VAAFYKCLYECNLRGGGVDKLMVAALKQGLVRGQDLLSSSFAPRVRHSFPWKSIWRTKAPPRVAFFAWTAAWGKILTVDNLRRRGHGGGEQVLALRVGWRSRLTIFFSTVGPQEPCGTPSSIRFGLCWVMPRSVQELLASWCSGGSLQEELLFGKWSLYVSCGVFGMSKTIDVSRIPRGLLRNSSSFSFLPFSPGQRAGWPHGR
jgi:hypothetical protein